MLARISDPELQLVVTRGYRAPKDRAQAGGDIVVVSSRDDDMTTVLVGDVSCNGREGQAFAGWMATIFRIHASTDPDPSRLLAVLNSHMCTAFTDPVRGLFATAFVCQWNPSRSCCSYASAGAETPLIADRAGGFERLSVISGMALGIEKGADYASSTLHVDPGDVLIAYTDGLVNARRRDSQDRFDDSALAAVFSQGVATASEALSAVDLSVGSYDDDATLVMMRFSAGRAEIAVPRGSAGQDSGFYEPTFEDTKRCGLRSLGHG